MTYYGVSNAEAVDRFIPNFDRLLPGPREAVCPRCNYVAPVAGFQNDQCGECRETRKN